MLDKIAYWTVKSLRFPTDVFFQVRACSQFTAFAVQLISPVFRSSIDRSGVFYCTRLY